MKLQKIHLFILILLIIIGSSFGFVVKEYMANREEVILGDDDLDTEEDSEAIWSRRRGGNVILPMSKDIKKHNIPEGDEDLYILKSQIVPPVCPKCPDNRNCPRPKPCPPCKPCGRCPESTFECKKVSINNTIQPSSYNNNMNYGSIGGLNPGDNISGGSSLNNGYATKNSSDNVQNDNSQKKYNSNNSIGLLPRPRLNTFAQF
jgi:hypothetical protein